MKFDILTLFPEMFEPLKHSILSRAESKKLIEINLINIRDFSNDKHNHVDDTPYGGGAGMVMRADVVYEAYKSVLAEEEDELQESEKLDSKKESAGEYKAQKKSTGEHAAKKKTKVIYLSPKGKKLNQEKVKELSNEEHLILLCGHYEGIDQRVIDKIVDEEISVGDYVLTGGELPAMIVVDSVSRYVDGVLSEGSTDEESFSNNLLEYPQYTRPLEFDGEAVPEVLTSGNHQEIDKWRAEQSLIITYKRRPELLSDEQKRQAEELILRKE